MSSQTSVRLRALRDELLGIPAYPWSGIAAWTAKAQPLIDSQLSDHKDRFDVVTKMPQFPLYPRAMSRSGRDLNQGLRQKEQAARVQTAEAAKAKIVAFLDGLLDVLGSGEETPTQVEAVLVDLFEGFHRAARQLTKRQRGRDAFEIKDEYDAQDLLHSLLRIWFEDVRPEEYTPSYGGGSKRMDFLLKRERVVIEVKMTRDGLDDKTVSQELIIDIDSYKAHQDCSTLFCFVYDPDDRLKNPRGIESDLSREEAGYMVRVFIRPS